MPLHLYRSNHTETLLNHLVANLIKAPPTDPFAEIPIAVGLSIDSAAVVSDV